MERTLSSMRSVQLRGRAGPLELNQSHAIPQPDTAAGEHLLKVHATAITRGEIYWPFPEEIYKDYSPCIEMSGTVMIAPKGSRFLPGSEVYMRTSSPRSGSAREYTIGLESELALKPRNLNHEQAAAVPGSAETAWQAIFVQAGIEASFDKFDTNSMSDTRKKVLIIGASGSVGLWTAQLARAAGCWVVGTSHSRNSQLARDFGVHEIIEYNKTTVREWLSARKLYGAFDLVLDCVYPGVSEDAWYAAHPARGLVLALVPAEGDTLKWTIDRPDGISPHIEGRLFIMESNGQQLQLITDLIEAGTVRPVVDSAFKLEDFKEAFDRAHGGQTAGKVVLRVI